jgi:glycine cleavage system transcriptional repressor
MHTQIVITLTGTDRTGIVEDLTKRLLDHGGNVETSRMARLGGEFAVLMLVSLPVEHQAALERSIKTLNGQGFKVTTTRTGQAHAEAHADWPPYTIEVLGADHEGIIHDVAQALSLRGINIESMDTGTTQAPNSGATLFSMTALVVIPPGLMGQGWEAALLEAGNHLQVDIKVSAATKP